jgi:hypothetical protein
MLNSLLKLNLHLFDWDSDPEVLIRLERPSLGRTHQYLYGPRTRRMAEDDDDRPDFKEKADPRLKTKEYRELARTLEKMEEQQKINYLKKRLTNHICSIYIESHPELGLVADEDPRMVSELQKRLHRIQKILDDSPLYSPFLRGMNTDKYNETGWSRRQALAKPYIADIKVLIRKTEGKITEKEPKIAEIALSDMIYDNENKKNSTLLPEVFLMRGMYYLMKIQRIESLRFASDKDLSKLRANHGNYRYALRHISKGIFNGGLTLFNIVMFGSIFDRYLQNYRTWLALEMIAIQFSQRLEVDQLRNKVDRHVATIKNIRKNNKNIPILRRMYPWFPDGYIYQRLKLSDLKTAIKNHEHKHRDRKVGGIVTRQMIALFMNLSLFLAGSPLARLAIILSREITSTDLDIILQKRMVESTQMLNNYYRMLGLGIDSRKGEENSYKLLQGIVNHSHETIERYVMKRGGSLEKSFERDPYIKTYTSINAFLQAYPDEGKGRKLLHNFLPQAERLLKSSVKSTHIKAANTIVHNIKTSARRHKKLMEDKRN